jgi:hypothetical protein
MKAVIVTWDDAYTMDEWSTKSDIVNKLRAQPKGEPTASCGFLFEETDKSIVLVQSEQPMEEVTEATFAGLLLIPRGMVQEIEVLKD